MNFLVAGPFEVPRYGKKQNITKDARIDLLDKVDGWCDGLSEACGCYVFAKQAGGGITPWYVGQACRSPLLAEALNASNITKYNEALDGAGTPLLFLLPAVTPKGKLRARPKAGALSEIDFLERWLIATALDKNPNLMNSQATRFLRGLHVVGIFNARQGESTVASKGLAKALW